MLSYVFVGALLGAIGGGFSGLQSAGEWFSTAAGVLLILSGIWMMRIFPWMGFKQEISLSSEKKPFLLSLYTKTSGILLASPTVESKFYIGLLTPLLPCGLLYSAFMIAAASGSAVNGAVTMALFGGGIVPSLIIVGFVLTFFRFRLRVWGDKLAAIMIVVMGIIMVMRGLGIPMPWMMMGGGTSSSWDVGLLVFPAFQGMEAENQISVELCKNCTVSVEQIPEFLEIR